MTRALRRTGCGGTAPAPIPAEAGAAEMRHRVIGLLVGLSLLAAPAEAPARDALPGSPPDRHNLV
ncbi:MAG: hypothetical protein ACO1OK_08040 [Devosia sp.]